MRIRNPFVTEKKALSEMVHNGYNSLWGAFANRTRRDYSAMLSDPTSSSLIMSVILWIVRRWPEAPVYLEDAKGEPVYDHPMLEKLNRPNPNYSGAVMWFGALMSFVWDGNGYLVKIRNKRDLSVRELWYVPHFLMEPMINEGSHGFIDYYQYTPGGGAVQRLLPEDVIHLRYGVDPYNPRKGMSPLKSVARDAITDEEADNFSASMLLNMGVPGLLITPDIAAGSVVNAPDPAVLKKYVKEQFAGDKRGEPMVWTAPTKIQQFGFDPKAMDLSTLRGIPEERVSAVTGIPAAVVGFGSGLAQTKVGAPQPLSATLWTKTGPIEMGDVCIGQEIATPTGWSKIKGIFPQGIQKIYKITFQDGSFAESTIDHLWQVKTPNEKENIYKLSEIANFPYWKLRRTFIPLQGITEFNAQPTLIPPYLFGLLLGDGTFRSNLSLSNTSEEIIDYARKELPENYDLIHASRGDYRITYKFANKGKGIGNGTGANNPFKDELRKLGLWMKYSQEKFIPDLYKYNSSQVRMEVLRGLFDSDGYVNLHGQPAIEQTSPQLANDITWLVQSLGGYTLNTLKRCNRNTRMISGHKFHSNYDRQHLTVVVGNSSDYFKMDYKKSRAIVRTKDATRKFRSIEYIRVEETQCIKLDGGLYLTDNFIVTHNTMKELREMAYEDGIIPIQRLIGPEIEMQLLGDFEPDPNSWRVRFDLSGVRVLQDDQDALYRRTIDAFNGGLISRAQGKQALGFEALPTDDIRRVPFSVVEVPEGEALLPTMPEPAPVKALRAPETKGMSNRGRAFISSQLKAHTRLSAVYAPILTDGFERIADRVVKAYLDLVESGYVKARSAEMKEDTLAEDADPVSISIDAHKIMMEAAKLSGLSEELAWQAQYLNVTTVTAKNIEAVFGVALNLSDPVMRGVLAKGGKHIAIVNIDKQTQAGIFKALTEGRTAGQGPREIAREMRSEVEGRSMYPGLYDAAFESAKARGWSDEKASAAGDRAARQYRAELIARTETKYAQNVSTLELAKGSGTFDKLQAVDAQLGPTDEICEERNGGIYSFEDAEAETEEEHPNGTLSWTPIISEE